VGHVKSEINILIGSNCHLHSLIEPQQVTVAISEDLEQNAHFRNGNPVKEINLFE
jgi:hypothetical protein